MPENDTYFIFTFGSGQPHAGFYVKIKGTFETARAKKIEKYGTRWGFQYTEQQWLEWLNEKPAWLPAEQLLETIE